MDEMKEVVTCKVCGKDEYYGMLHWAPYIGQVCRKCMYREWQRTEPTWKPSETDYVFPLYQDGKDYRK